MSAGHKTYTLEELIENARCRRGTYNPDKCVAHGSASFPYDERVCDVVLSILGYTPRRSLGDGRARGRPILPVR